MGQTLANLGPQMGQAGAGFVQGRQMATQEDQSRQMMALRAAQEGRAKEEHRLSIQQLGLQIQDQQRQAALNQKLDPMRVEQGDQALQGGRDATPGYEDFIGGILGGGFQKNMRPDLTRDEVDSGAGMYLRDRGFDISGQRVNDAADKATTQQDVQWARIQAQNIREDIKSKRLDKKAVETTLKSLRENMAEETEIQEAEQELQMIADELRVLDASLNEYTADLGPKSGVASPAPKRNKLAPPPIKK